MLRPEKYPSPNSFFILALVDSTCSTTRINESCKYLGKIFVKKNHLVANDLDSGHVPLLHPKTDEIIYVNVC